MGETAISLYRKRGYRDGEGMGVIFIVVFTTLPKGAILSIE